MIDYIVNFELNGLMGILLYWAPAGFCVAFYTVRTARDYIADKARREEKEYYVPQLTVGTLIGRALISVVPIGNLWAALFDLAPDVFRKAFDLIGRVFDQPLVPSKPQAGKK